MPLVPVDVEVILFRLRDGELCHRIVRHALDPDRQPDEVALEVAALGVAGVCHSTSWRYEGGAVVLTYAALPDPSTASGAAPVIGVVVASSGDPLRPSPPDMQTEHVVAHAVRHLAYLARTDPVIAAVADAEGPDGCWAAVRGTGAESLVATTSEVHHRRDARWAVADC